MEEDEKLDHKEIKNIERTLDAMKDPHIDDIFKEDHKEEIVKKIQDMPIEIPIEVPEDQIFPVEEGPKKQISYSDKIQGVFGPSDKEKNNDTKYIDSRRLKKFNTQ